MIGAALVATGHKRSGGHTARKAIRGKPTVAPFPLLEPGLGGGRYAPLADRDIVRFIDSVFEILERVGIADAPTTCTDLVTRRGGTVDADGRLLFPRALVNEGLGSAAQEVILRGLDPSSDISIGGDRIHLGAGGAAVSVLDNTTGTYRDSTLLDLFQLGRVADACEHVRYFLRPVIARDMPDNRTLDLNTAYACMAATGKPIGSHFSTPETVAEAVTLFDLALGGNGRFRDRPVCFGSVCHVVPPLRFAADACATLEAMVRLGMPVQLCAAGQVGATNPAALAGALVQSIAECLAGLVYVNLMSPGHPCVFTVILLVTDFRTGAVAGGTGECAVINAAAAQILRHLGLPSAVGAGMTDSAAPDYQAGYEKDLTVTLAAHAGANMVNLSSGMLGSIMGASAEAMVIDNDMHGAILRSVRGIDVNDEALSVDVIAETVRGEGHYLGHSQTLALMDHDFVYPHLGDRLGLGDREDVGTREIRERARERVRRILSADLPEYIEPSVDATIRDRFPIRLSRHDMTRNG